MRLLVGKLWSDQIKLLRRLTYTLVSVGLAIIVGFLSVHLFKVPLDLQIVQPDSKAILAHNSGLALLLVVGSMLSLGILGYLLLVVNGFVAGVIAGNLSLAQLLGVFLPYVGLELASFCLFVVIGLCMADNLRNVIRYKQLARLLDNEIPIKTLLVIGMVGLSLAAWIEGLV